MELPVPVPPDHEQVDLLIRLREGMARLDSLSRATERSIQLLKEHRSALITATVTGQLDPEQMRGDT